MAEVILAVLCILVGLLCAGLAVLTLWANAIGGATNREAVNVTPVIVFAIVALAAIGGGVAMLVW